MKSDMIHSVFENDDDIEWFVSLCWNLGLFCCSILDYLKVSSLY